MSETKELLVDLIKDGANALREGVVYNDNGDY